jgi:hypothetical protein
VRDLFRIDAVRPSPEAGKSCVEVQLKAFFGGLPAPELEGAAMGAASIESDRMAHGSNPRIVRLPGLIRLTNRSLKRQLPATNLRKILAIKKLLAMAQIIYRICAIARRLFLAQAFANLNHAQLPF